MRDVGSGDMGVLTDEVIDLINVVAEKKATFPDEIKAITGLRSSKITNIKARLVDKEILENLRPNKKHSDRRLLSRRNEMWSRGVQGQKQFGKRSWIGLNSELTWRLISSKEKGYQVVNEYHNPVYFHRIDYDDKPIAIVEGKSISDYLIEVLENGY